MQRSYKLPLVSLQSALDVLTIAAEGGSAVVTFDREEAKTLVAWIKPLMEADLPGIVEASWQALEEQGVVRDGAGPLPLAIAETFEKRRQEYQSLSATWAQVETKLNSLIRIHNDQCALNNKLTENFGNLFQQFEALQAERDDYREKLNAANVQLFEKENAIGTLGIRIKELEVELTKARNGGDLKP
jgi:hypothetical protein